jgi:hypothetical protein
MIKPPTKNNIPITRVRRIIRREYQPRSLI